MISRIFRPIRDGFKGVGRHASMSIQSASAVTLALIIISLFLMFSMTVQNFTKGIEESVSISVLVDYSKESAEDEDAISLAIKNISGVSTVTYSSKDEEFQYYLESFDDEKTRKAFEPFKDSNPMHDAFYVETTSGSNIEAIAEEISNIEGVYKDPKDPSTLISELEIKEAKELIADGYIGGGMLPKLQNCIDAIESGVSRVHILDGRIPHCLLLEIFTNKGIGTAILNQKESRYYDGEQ